MKLQHKLYAVREDEVTSLSHPAHGREASRQYATLAQGSSKRRIAKTQAPVFHRAISHTIVKINNETLGLPCNVPRYFSLCSLPGTAVVGFEGHNSSKTRFVPQNIGKISKIIFSPI